MRRRGDTHVRGLGVTAVPLKGPSPPQAALEPHSAFPSGISPKKAEECPASGKTPAPETEPDRRIHILLL